MEQIEKEPQLVPKQAVKRFQPIATVIDPETGFPMYHIVSTKWSKIMMAVLGALLLMIFAVVFAGFVQTRDIRQNTDRINRLETKDDKNDVRQDTSDERQNTSDRRQGTSDKRTDRIEHK